MRKIDTPHGPVLVRRGASDRAVVYVHGYGDTVESVVRKHRLEAQLQTDATVIIPEAPSSRDERVNFPNLGELLCLVGVPGASVTALGHSGGYRTLRAWLDSPQLHEVVMLDAAYGDVEPFIRWGRGAGRVLRIVGYSTADKSRKIAAAVGTPYYQGRGHFSIVTTEGWISRFVRAGERSFLWSAGVAVVLVTAYLLIDH